jgi:hypothetical protein
MFDYPAIYREADNISNKTQRYYLIILRLFLCMLVVSSLLFTYLNSYIVLKIINAVISLAIIIFSFIFRFYNFQGIWYTARAVAESIKTISWRYAIKAEPYNISDNVAKILFLKTIKDILDMNHDFKKYIEANYGDEQSIPNNMIDIRQLPLKERLDFYYKYRIIEQRDWYIIKSKFNKRQSNLFSCALIIIPFILFVTILISFINLYNNFIFPISILLSLISVIFTWIQTKKYRELEKSYALASHEINFFATQKDDIKSEDAFSQYVLDSENAFSREHTQWVARKGS